jgi:hypothetical protein
VLLSSSNLTASPTAAVLFELNRCTGPCGGALCVLSTSTADFGGPLTCRGNAAAAGQGGCIANRGGSIIFRGDSLFEGTVSSLGAKRLYRLLSESLLSRPFGGGLYLMNSARAS